MNVEIVHDADALATRASKLMHELIAEAQEARGVATIALSGGSTPGETYRRLAALELDVARCRWFFVDERCVPPTSERSNFAAAQRDLFQRIGAPAETVFRMPGERDAKEAARDYAALLCREHGVSPEHALDGGHSAVKLDLIIAGMGNDGHTASLFPGTGAVSRDKELVTVVEPGGGLERRISLTRPVLIAARRVLVLVCGEAKRAALSRALGEGPEDEVPSRLYRAAEPGVVSFIVDRSALG